MIRRMNRWCRRGRVVLLGAALVLMMGAGVAAAAGDADAVDPHGVVDAAEGGGLQGLVAVGAGLAIGLCALATGMAQARIGAAGIGAISENPKRIGMVIMLVAIPETVAILGFVIAYLMIS